MTAALLTPPGRGAVAVIRVVGPATVCDAAFAAANGRAASAQPVGRVAFGRWGASSEEDGPGEELILVRTAADETEIHCHGGTAAAARVFADLAAAGVRAVPWEEQEAERHGVLQAELAAALAAAPTGRCAGVLLDQASGTLARGLADPAEHAAMRGRVEFGRHLTEPWLVVLAGPPNAGKSSLLNALAGYGRALVSPTAGTTRDALGVTIAVDGWPVRLTDTAGLRETADPLEAAGVARAREVLAEADAVIDVADGGGPAGPRRDGGVGTCAPADGRGLDEDRPGGRGAGPGGAGGGVVGHRGGPAGVAGPAVAGAGPGPAGGRDGGPDHGPAGAADRRGGRGRGSRRPAPRRRMTP